MFDSGDEDEFSAETLQTHCGHEDLRSTLDTPALKDSVQNDLDSWVPGSLYERIRESVREDYEDWAENERFECDEDCANSCALFKVQEIGQEMEDEIPCMLCNNRGNIEACKTNPGCTDMDRFKLQVRNACKIIERYMTEEIGIR